MVFQNTSVSVTYNRIEKINETYYKNKQILNDFFDEGTVFSMPENAPLEVPRIIINTHHRHGTLNISPIATTFSVIYNDGFEKDWDSCVGYIRERMNSVFMFLDSLTNNNYSYIGVVTNLIYDEILQDGCKVLSDKLLNSQKINGLYDINIRYTFETEKDLFVNIMLQNARIYKKGIDISKRGTLDINNQEFESIGSTIDINDRLGFNRDANYKSNKDRINDILDEMSLMFHNRLSNLIERGEYL